MQMLRTILVLFLSGSLGILHAASIREPLFRVGLANIYFMASMFENNVENPIFSPPKSPPSKAVETEFDRLNQELIARYIRYLDADVLVICEAPADMDAIQEFSDRYLNGRYVLVHNSPVVRNRKYYFNQQIAALVDRQKFNLRKYEALDQEEVEQNNRMYPFSEYKTKVYEGESKRIYWSRFPIEFDLELKGQSGHWFKFIASYPKSKFARSPEAAKFARFKNSVHQEMIRERVEQVAPQFEDVFVLGDLNDSLGMDEIEKELGVDSISLLYQGRQDPVLWNPIVFREGEGTYIYKGKAEVIDFIFTSHGLKKAPGIVKPKIWEHDHFFKSFVRETKTPSPDRLKHRQLFISDHAPLTLDVY